MNNNSKSNKLIFTFSVLLVMAVLNCDAMPSTSPAPSEANGKFLTALN